jgi:hypothetical protein
MGERSVYEAQFVTSVMRLPTTGMDSRTDPTFATVFGSGAHVAFGLAEAIELWELLFCCCVSIFDEVLLPELLFDTVEGTLCTFTAVVS